MLDQQPFVTQVEGWPQRPFLSGAFAYDLVQWTQPIRVQLTGLRRFLRCSGRWTARCSSIVPRAEHACTSTVTFGRSTQTSRRARDPPPVVQRSGSSSMDDAQHAEAIEAVKQAIVDGRMYQVNIGRRWTGPLDDEPWDVMRRLLEETPPSQRGRGLLTSTITCCPVRPNRSCGFMPVKR